MDRAFVLVREGDGSVPPGASDPAWSACTTTLPMFMLLPVDGTHTIEAWAKDKAGNISAAASVVSVVLDTTAPTLAVIQPADGDAVAAGVPYQIQWLMLDANQGATPILVELSTNGGSTFTDIGTQPMSNSGMLTWNVPALANANVRLRVTATDLAANATSTTVSLIISSAPPDPRFFFLNGETGPTGSCGVRAAPTSSPYALVELQVDDPIGANVTHLCFKAKSSTPPAANDPCFLSVRAPPISVPPNLVLPAPSLHITNLPVRLGYVKGDVTVRVWSKNAAGLVSSLSGGGSGTECIDRRTILFDPGDPPVVSNVTTFVTDTPSDPYVPADVTLDAGHTKVFVKWNVAPTGLTGPTGLSGPISLEYTQDDFNYTPLPGTLGITGGTGCTFDPAVHTGCFVWSSAPQTGYLKVRVRATNSKDISTVSSSVPPINTSPIRFLVGNPDPGYGGNGNSALFVSHVTQSTWDLAYATLTVSSRGVIYFLDREYGIQWIDPTTGNVDTLVRVTGTVADGAVKAATAKSVWIMTMDHDDNVVFWDYDRIRRINVNAERMPEGTQVETIIGGGSATSYVGDNQDPLIDAIVTPNAETLVVLPNGDMYFNTAAQGSPSSSVSEFALRHYVKATNKVQTIHLTGNGFWSYYPASAADVPANTTYTRTFNYTWIAYDANTSAVQRSFSQVWNDMTYGYGLATFDENGVTTTPHLQPPFGNSYNVNCGFPIFTGMDGNIYLFDSCTQFGLFKYDLVGDQWTRIAGGGTAITTPCQDSPPPDALSCRIDIQDAFVDSAGRVYWIAWGKIYTITEDNKILKILGQGYDFGEGGPPLAARLGNIPSFDYWRDANNRDRVVVADAISVRYRESVFNNNVNDGPLDADENKITAIAGNGTNGYAASYFSYSIVAPSGTSGVTGATGITDGPDARTLPLPMIGGRYQGTTFTLDRSNGVLYHGTADYGTARAFMRLRRDRPVPEWEAFTGAGSVSYVTAPDGTAGRDVSFYTPPASYLYQSRVYGVNNGAVLYQIVNENGPLGDFWDSMLKLFDTGTYVAPNPPPVATNAITHFAGVPGTATTGVPCPSGSARETCVIGCFYNASPTPASYDSGGAQARWILATEWSNVGIRAYEERPGGQVWDVTTLPQPMSFAYRRTAGHSYLYYCDSFDGHLYRKEVEPDGLTVQLPWPVPVRAGDSLPTLRCNGNAMHFNPTRVWDTGKVGTLMFSFEQYGLWGVAEYYDEPP
jgi:hypothetical protein